MRVVLFLVPNNIYYISLLPMKKGCNSSMSSNNTEKQIFLRELQLRAVTTMVILFSFFFFFFLKRKEQLKGRGDNSQMPVN